MRRSDVHFGALAVHRRCSPTRRTIRRMFDLVITDATLIDGTGTERRQADVAVRDGRIAAVVDVDPNGSGP
ncbi:MAG: hypothetical protein KA129_10675, partial [Microthrixaceae bacterium]|nr:hypothetical protein [Microthrixaceae bacterium]